MNTGHSQNLQSFEAPLSSESRHTHNSVVHDLPKGRAEASSKTYQAVTIAVALLLVVSAAIL